MMGKKEKTEEIQSRREFFKKAAKKALPIIGIAMLANSPIFAQSDNLRIMGCKVGCTGGCRTLCEEGCSHSCNSNCKGSCTGHCDKSCQGSATTYWK